MCRLTLCVLHAVVQKLTRDVESLKEGFKMHRLLFLDAFTLSRSSIASSSSEKAKKKKDEETRRKDEKKLFIANVESYYEVASFTF
jgi:hypothetical protein